MKNSWIIDIEVFPNFFFIGVKDYKKQSIYEFEISKEKNEIHEIKNVFSKYDGYLISFNGVSYDEMVIKYILKDFDKLKNLSIDELLVKIKLFSDEVIRDNFEVIKYYKWWKTDWISIDLYLYWSKMLRQSKQLSLKALAIQLNWDEIQELPYEHNKLLNKEEIQQIKRYNLRNDLGISELLFNKMKEDISLRHYIKEEYDLECWSMDAPKIANELMIRDYCSKKYNPELGQTYEEYLKEFKNQRYTSYDGFIKDVMGGFEVEFEIPQFKKLKEDMYNSTRNFSLEIPFIYNNTSLKISYGIGGLHSINENEIYVSDENSIVVTSDYASLYPNIIINWKCIRFTEVLEKYISVKEDRLVAKKQKLKKKDTVLKLILNSLSGMLDNSNSPLYYPEGALRMRIIGQLILTKTAELCILEGYKVVSLNTDGLEVIIPKNKFEDYKNLLKQAEEMFNISLEHEIYKKIAYSNVNNYIAITDSGKIKRKGSYFKLTRDENNNSEIPLGDSVNENIICRALSAYFINNIDPSEYISHPEKYGNHIYDYCLSKKINKDYEVFHNQQKVQNLNRYYFSRKAPFLFKRKKGKSTFEHVNKDGGVIIFNKFVDKPWQEYEINYPYYISKTRKIIQEIETKQRELTLF